MMRLYKHFLLKRHGESNGNRSACSDWTRHLKSAWRGLWPVDRAVSRLRCGEEAVLTVGTGDRGIERHDEG